MYYVRTKIVFETEFQFGMNKLWIRIGKKIFESGCEIMYVERELPNDFGDVKKTQISWQEMFCELLKQK